MTSPSIRWLTVVRDNPVSRMTSVFVSPSGTSLNRLRTSPGPAVPRKTTAEDPFMAGL